MCGIIDKSSPPEYSVGGLPGAGRISGYRAARQRRLPGFARDSLAHERNQGRREQRQACGPPIVVRSCDWSVAPFARLKMLPCDLRPIALHSRGERDAVWAEVARELRSLLTFTFNRVEASLPAVGPPGGNAGPIVGRRIDKILDRRCAGGHLRRAGRGQGPPSTAARHGQGAGGSRA